jgi:hypothetical protein
MIYQYSYTYKQGPELSDHEIYQQQVAHEEALAELKKVVVSLYRYKETPEEITLRCQKCFQEDEGSAGLEYIDKAAEGDMCAVCGAENFPKWYHGEI